VAVFIGRELGGWQRREMVFALDRQVREEKQSQGQALVTACLGAISLGASTAELRLGAGPQATTRVAPPMRGLHLL
jgi:hypothetical protein